MSDEFTGWRKSSCSASANCVEVGSGPAVIGVRDSKLAASPVLAFSGETWRAFTATLKRHQG